MSMIYSEARHYLCDSEIMTHVGYEGHTIFSIHLNGLLRFGEGYDVFRGVNDVQLSFHGCVWDSAYCLSILKVPFQDHVSPFR